MNASQEHQAAIDAAYEEGKAHGMMLELLRRIEASCERILEHLGHAGEDAVAGVVKGPV